MTADRALRCRSPSCTQISQEAGTTLWRDSKGVVKHWINKDTVRLHPHLHEGGSSGLTPVATCAARGADANLPNAEATFSIQGMSKPSPS
jgi:hypothetical protein